MWKTKCGKLQRGKQQRKKLQQSKLQQSKLQHDELQRSSNVRLVSKTDDVVKKSSLCILCVGII